MTANTVTDTLVAGCGSRRSTYAKQYEFTLDAGALITFTLSMDDLDAYLYLLDANGNVIAANDDSAFHRSNSRIRRHLGPGTYIIDATAWEERKTGSFTLKVSGTTIR